MNTVITIAKVERDGKGLDLADIALCLRIAISEEFPGILPGEPSGGDPSTAYTGLLKDVLECKYAYTPIHRNKSICLNCRMTVQVSGVGRHTLTQLQTFARGYIKGVMASTGIRTEETAKAAREEVEVRKKAKATAGGDFRY
jgi:hypothetical protein